MPMQIQPAVKKESIYTAAGTFAGAFVMFLAFWLLHRSVPDVVPFDYRVIAAGLAGSAVACANFFFMGLTIQKITGTDNQDEAYKAMKASYRFRTLSQLLWVVLAFALPCFNAAAGIIPLFLPSMCINLRGMMGIIK